MDAAKFEQAMLISQNPELAKSQRDKAEEYMEQCLQNPNTCEAIIQLLNATPRKSEELRVVATVLLRKNLVRYFKVNMSKVAGFQTWVLKATMTDPARAVRRVLGDCIAVTAAFVIGVHEKQWPQLFETIAAAVNHKEESYRELGIQIFTKVSMEQDEVYSKNLAWAVATCITCCKDPSEKVRLGGIAAMVNLVRGEDHKVGDSMIVKTMKLLMQTCMDSLNRDEFEVAQRAMQGMEELSGDMFSTYKTTAADAFKLCLWVLDNPKSKEENSVEIAAYSLLCSLIQQFKGPVRKSGLIPNCIRTCMRHLVTDEDFGDEEAGDSSIHAAVAVIRQMVMQFSAKYVFNPICQAAMQCLKDPQPRVQAAGLEILGVVSEGCMESLALKLDQLVPIIVRASQQPHVMVVRHGLLCLGMWCENMPDRMAKYHDTVIPLAGKHLLSKHDKIQITGVYIIECLSEAVQPEQIAKYTPSILSAVSGFLTSSEETQRERGLALLSAVALASKASFVPHVQSSMSVLLRLMDPSNGDTNLKGRAIETTGQIAASVGQEAFRPYVVKVSQLLNAALRDHAADPSLVEMVYTCFANFAIALKTAMAPIIPGIVQTVLKDLKTKDMIQQQFSKTLRGERDDDDLDPEEVQAQLKTADAVTEKRAGAIQVLAALATHCGSHFHKFLGPAMKQVIDDLYYPSLAVKRAAITTVTALCLSYCDLAGVPEDLPMLPNPPYQPSAQLQTVIWEVHRELLEIGTIEDDIECVARSLEGINEILTKVGARMFTPDPQKKAPSLEDLMTLLKSLLDEKAACQGGMHEMEAEMEAEESAEMAKMVIDVVTDLLGQLALHFGPKLEPIFRPVYPSLTRWAAPTRAMTDRSTAIGCFAEMFEGMKEGASSYAPNFIKMVMDIMHSAGCPVPVLRNCCYALGVAISHASPAVMAGKSAAVVELVRPYVTRPDGQDESLRDNAAGCIARIIVKCYDEMKPNLAGPLQLMLGAMPLQDDLMETAPVLRCLGFLVQKQDATLAAQKAAMEAKLRLTAADQRVRSNQQAMAMLQKLASSIGLSPRK